MISKTYTKFALSALNKEIDFVADTVKCMLLSGHTPDQVNDQYVSDVNTDEVPATGGYSAGGLTVTGKSSVASGLTVTLDCADLTVGSSTISATHAVFYIDTGSPATSPLINYHDFEGTIASTNGDFDITIGGTGLATLTVA